MQDVTAQGERRDDFFISSDRSLIDIDAVHSYLMRSYWAEGIPREVVAKSIEHSLCFGVYTKSVQIGFARVVTDSATFAYLCDVYILEDYRGRGLSKWLMATIMSHPSLQGLRRFTLITKDAHGLYRQFGFTPIANPAGFMEIVTRDIYKRSSSG